MWVLRQQIQEKNIYSSWKKETAKMWIDESLYKFEVKLKVFLIQQHTKMKTA